ncbi:hypothetical protein [uncultured Herbaspirillum sp.]|uniref:hypothetical protein n=1 Tax=uncultured Herbaspirillum sp. TaxID=160236 RepID=UPI0025905C8F|nr:hypothetical protein [uncultured Herbaspirillum sp.]
MSLSICRSWQNFSDRCSLPLKHPLLAIGMFTLCLACIGLTLYALKITNPKKEITIVESKHIPADLMNYVLPYVVSFMSLDYQEANKFFGFLIFLVWIFLISYKSGQIILNPVLTVFGWKLYEIKFHFLGSQNLHTARALSKVPLETKEAYLQKAIQDVLIIKEKKDR